jgi:hypothetical protein
VQTKRLASRLREPFSGDPTKQYQAAGELIKGQEHAEEDVALSELDRLSAVVSLIDFECAIVPRGALYLTAAKSIATNENYQGTFDDESFKSSFFFFFLFFFRLVCVLSCLCFVVFVCILFVSWAFLFHHQIQFEFIFFFFFLKWYICVQVCRRQRAPNWIRISTFAIRCTTACANVWPIRCIISPVCLVICLAQILF